MTQDIPITDPFAGLGLSEPVKAAVPSTPEPITERQLNFLTKLLSERPMFQDVENLWPENIAKLTKRQASIKIDEVLKVAKEVVARPAVHTPAAPLPVIQSGRYALIAPDGITVKFYKVNCPTEGRWAGYTFIDAQASDDFFPIRNPAERKRIVEEILADEDSLARYGRELGKCGRCGRKLTSEWRKRGIGPVCNAKAW